MCNNTVQNIPPELGRLDCVQMLVGLSQKRLNIFFTYQITSLHSCMLDPVM